MTFCSVKIYLAKKDKNNLTKHFVPKELRRSDFLIAIEEYVGAKGNTLVDHKKRKKYKKGIKDIRT